jgi:hypothetical protein
METIDSPPLEIIPAGIELAEETRVSIEHGFATFFAKAKELIAQAGNITSPKMARVARLEFKALRVAAEKARKALKEDSVRYGKAVDGANNILLAAIVPHEERLEEIEKAEERRIAAENEARGIARWDQLSTLGVTLYTVSQLGTMPEPDFRAVLDDAQALHEARVKREEEEKAAALAQQVAEAKERERIRLENEQLLREAAEREAAAKLERERAAAEKARTDALMSEIQGIQYQAVIAKAGRLGVRKGGTIECIKETLAETEAWEIDSKHFGDLTETAMNTKNAAVDSIRAILATAEAEEKAQYERMAATLREKELADRAKAERDALEAKHRAEQAKAEAQAAKERAAREKIEEAQRIEREAREKEQRAAAEAEFARKEDEARKLREAEEAAEKAAAAPDKQKVLAYLDALHSIPRPTLKSKKAIRVFQLVLTDLNDIYESARLQVSKL